MTRIKMTVEVTIREQTWIELLALEKGHEQYALDNIGRHVENALIDAGFAEDITVGTPVVDHN